MEAVCADQARRIAELKRDRDGLIEKMNGLAKRTTESLFKFSQTYDLKDLLIPHRFLLSVQNPESHNNNTPIHEAALHGHHNVLSSFLRTVSMVSYLKDATIDSQNNARLTPLLIAARRGDVKSCELLLEAGASLSKVDSFGQNVFHIACFLNHVPLFKLFESYIREGTMNLINEFNYDGLAPIHMATIQNSKEIFDALLARPNLDVNIKDKRYGFTPLHYAAMAAIRTPLVNKLARDPRIDVDAKSYTGAPPLHVAVLFKNFMAALCLKSRGADMKKTADVPLFLDWIAVQDFQHNAQCLRKCIEQSNASKYVVEHKKVNTAHQSPGDLLIECDFETWSMDMSNEFKEAIQHTKKQARLPHPPPFDVWFYARDDDWMQETLNSVDMLPKHLVKKAICFERAKMQIPVMNNAKLV